MRQRLKIPIPQLLKTWRRWRFDDGSCHTFATRKNVLWDIGSGWRWFDDSRLDAMEIDLYLLSARLSIIAVIDAQRSAERFPTIAKPKVKDAVNFLQGCYFRDSFQANHIAQKTIAKRLPANAPASPIIVAKMWQITPKKSERTHSDLP